jgi:hypothetical protein
MVSTVPEANVPKSMVFNEPYWKVAALPLEAKKLARVVKLALAGAPCVPEPE